MDKKHLINELKAEGFSDLIINAFEKVNREKFVPESLKQYAYHNKPLPIALGATISQPYTIAFMLNLLELDKLINSDLINTDYDVKKLSKHEKSRYLEKNKHYKSQKLDINKNFTNKKVENIIKILEIGSGSGYVLALMNEILKNQKIKNYSIYGIERIYELVVSSRKVLKNKNIEIIEGDGSKGLTNKASFDRILVSAAFEKIPKNLFVQLKENGILVTPVINSIFRFKKIRGKIETEDFPGFVFVPVVKDLD